ncbi:MAG TPA: DUF308 domain-containing protein [Gaiellaceae bacterium]|jgi:uncharacterized membrane protein HdeD (DUF308 family)
MLLSPISPKADFGVAEAESLAATWWLYLVAGIVSLVFGALILAVDWGVDSLAAFIGTLFILQGVAWLMTRSLDGGDRTANVVAGLVGAGAGLALLIWPDAGLYVLAAFIGVWIVVSGVLHVVGAIVNRHAPHWWLVLALGLVEIPIGIWALRRPGLTLAVIVTLAGVWAIVTGVWQIMMAFEVKNLPRRLRAA